MCTLTWFVKDNGYELFFNRDERKTRSRAQQPTKQQHAGVNYISPTDTDAGGTWIASNHFGITICLLNYYQFEQTKLNQNWISRGEIVRQFAISQSLAEADKVFEELNLSNYQAFRLFMIDANGQNRLFIWNGKQLKIETDIKSPKSSSSFNTKEVKASRYQLFADLNLTTSQTCDDFLNYHASHTPNKSAQSVCMHRDDANTVSMSHIDVNDTEASFAYADGSPCSVPLQKPISIALVNTENE